MANEFKIKNGFFSEGSSNITGSLTVSAGITGSLQGTATTASNITPAISNDADTRIITANGNGTLNGESNLTFNGSLLNVAGNLLVTGSATIGSSTAGASENSLTLGARDTSNEGGQLGFNAPGGTYTSASFIDNYTNKIRILKGNNTTSTGLVAQWDLHTTQMHLPAYTSTSAFPGTAVANLAVDSSGNVITVSTAGGTVFPYTGNAVITGSLTVTQPIYVPINGGMYFQGGDDAALYDINVVNTIGIYGMQDSTIGSIKLGSGGGIISGKSGNIGIGTTNPAYKLDVNGGSDATIARFYNSSATGTTIEVGDTGNSNYSELILRADSGLGAIFKGGSSFGSYGGANSLNIFNETGPISFNAPSATNAMSIISGGNVGIGTTSPGVKLHIQGSNITDSAIRIANTGAGGISWDIYSTNNGFDQGGGKLLFYRSVDGSSGTVVFDSTGSVGIGTVNPSTKLHVAINDNAFAGAALLENTNTGSSAQAAIAFKTANNAGSFSVGQINNGGGAVLYNAANAGMNFYTSASLRMTIAAGGNVGINTTSPLSKLDLSNKLYLNDSDGTYGSGYSVIGFSGLSNGANRIIGHNAGSDGLYLMSATSRGIYFRTNGGSTDNMMVDPSGNVGIGTITPSAKFHVLGASTDNVGLAYFENNHSAGSIYYPAAQFVNSYGNHSFGIVAGFKMGSSGGPDRPSILFYNDAAAKSWQVGQITSGWGSDDDFGIGYRASNDPNSFGNWPTNYFTITTAGYVGIGKTNPSNPLHTYQASSNFIQIETSGTPSNYSTYIGTSGSNSVLSNTPGMALYLDGGADIIFRPVGSELMRLTFDNKVGIGTTSPNAKLDVNGNTLITGSLRVTAGITGSLNGNADTATSVAWTDSATSTFAIAMSDGTTAYYDAAGDLRWDGGSKVISVTDGAETLSLNGKYIVQTGTGLLNYYADRHVFGDNAFNYQGQLIGGSFDAAQDITCGGTKFFDIPHQSKSGWGLKHGAIEGPESAVYFRGKLEADNIIQFPAYWEWLVHSETITVSLTPVGSFQPLYVEKIENNQAIIASNGEPINCHFVVYAERKDVGRWDVEYPGYSRGNISDSE
jgi:hypothetical protein